MSENAADNITDLYHTHTASWVAPCFVDAFFANFEARRP